MTTLHLRTRMQNILCALARFPVCKIFLSKKGKVEFKEILYHLYCGKRCAPKRISINSFPPNILACISEVAVVLTLDYEAAKAVLARICARNLGKNMDLKLEILIVFPVLL